MRQLARLTLVGAAALVAGVTGDRAAGAHAQDAEFADYRPYVPGDDLRTIDWNIYSRLHELSVKTSPGQARVELSILLDCSGSMEFGSPRKLWCAKRLAAGLAAIALLNGDTVSVHQLRDGRADARRPLQGGSALEQLASELEQVRGGGRTDLAASIDAYRRELEQQRQIVLISDVLVETSPEDLMKSLAAAGRSAALAQIVDPLEERPPLRGSVQLVDAETGARARLTVNAALRARYATSVEARVQVLRRACLNADVRYVRAPTTLTLLELMAGPMREARVVAG